MGMIISLIRQDDSDLGTNFFVDSVDGMENLNSYHIGDCISILINADPRSQKLLKTFTRRKYQLTL